jgi:hypothetical protein
MAERVVFLVAISTKPALKSSSDSLRGAQFKAREARVSPGG